MRNTPLQQPALQDMLPENDCYGCGPANTHGLQIKSHYTAGQAICHFTPQPFHSTFIKQFVNGGILASIVDCHSIWTAMAHAYAQENRAPGSLPEIRYVTANMNIDYLKPVPAGRELHLYAIVSKREGKKTWIQCEVRLGEQKLVHASVLAIRINPEWAKTQLGG